MSNGKGGYDPRKRRQAMREKAATRAAAALSNPPEEEEAPKTRARGQGISVQTPTGSILPPIDREVSGDFTGFDELPHMPAVLNELQSALAKGRADAKVIATMVGSDAAMTAKILRVVNSAYYGLSRPILDLKYAVAYLGFNEVYRIVLSVSVVDGLKIKDPKAIKDYWHHSYFTALVAKYLASLYDKHIDPAELWPAALLHDVGRLVYMKIYPRYHATLLDYCESHKCALVHAEQELGLPSHSAMGSLLALRWKLPDLIQDTCMHYALDDPASAGGTDLQVSFRRIVGCASRLIDLEGADLAEEHRDQIRRAVRKTLKITQSEFMSLLAQVRELREEADVFVAELN